MSEYLSKEEVKQWRSSLEKITLEEFATRLGKVVEAEKQTNDLVDIVLKGQPVVSKFDGTRASVEKITSIAQRAFDREKEISKTPFSTTVQDIKSKQKAPNVEKPVAKTSENTQSLQKDSSTDESPLVFKKALTDREQVIFECFAKHKNEVVYAKDLAKLLDLPRDYVYKYIKNLRSKIEGDKLQNSDNGGYVLTV